MSAQLNSSVLKIVVAMALVLLLGLGGCYHHVVRVNGPVSPDTPIYEPNLPADQPPNTDTTSKKVPSKTVPTQKAPSSSGG